MRLPALLACLLLLLPLGCRGPNQANIELRKQNQQLDAELARLRAENQQLAQDLHRLESADETQLLPTLPQERLAELWTVAGLRFGRLTGIDRRSEGHPLKVYLRPVDQDGDPIKAAGSITIEAFDLSASDVRIGRWAFGVEESRDLWNSGGLLNEYVLTCPWEGEAPAQGRKLLLKATFHDALTQRTLEQTREVQ